VRFHWGLEQGFLGGLPGGYSSECLYAAKARLRKHGGAKPNMRSAGGAKPNMRSAGGLPERIA